MKSNQLSVCYKLEKYVFHCPARAYKATSRHTTFQNVLKKHGMNLQQLAPTKYWKSKGMHAHVHKLCYRHPESTLTNVILPCKQGAAG